MNIEIKVVGDLYEHRNEVYQFVFAQQVYQAAEKVKGMIRDRRKYSTHLTEIEDEFLEEIQEMLYFEFLE